MRYAILFMSLMLAACASGPAYNPAKLAPLPPGHARIIAMRAFSVIGSGNSVTLKLDGKTFANLWGDSFCAIEPAAGIHVLTWARFLGARHTSLKLMPGETVYILAGYDYAGGIWSGTVSVPYGLPVFKAIDKEKALSLLPGLREGCND